MTPQGPDAALRVLEGQYCRAEGPFHPNLELGQGVAEVVHEKVVAFGTGYGPRGVDGSLGGESVGERAGGYVAEDACEEPLPQHLQFVPVRRNLGIDGSGVPVKPPAGRGASSYLRDEGRQFREPV